MTAFYNEIDPYAAQWLRNLIAAGHIAPGVVDERSIQDIAPDELKEFTQCHFFAGVGVWSLALRRAGWPDDRPVWTGSCPCQPFSAAGAGAGFSDLRHLWPDFAWQIDQCRPPIVFGEQVASKAVDTWVDLIHADLETMDYAFGAVPFPSAGVGAPHIRDRLFWVADSQGHGHKWAGQLEESSGWDGTTHLCAADDVADAESLGLPGEWRGACNKGAGGIDECIAANRMAIADGRHSSAEREQRQQPQDGGGCELGRLGDTQSMRREGERLRARSDLQTGGASQAGDLMRPGPVNGFWRAADWLGCRDDKWRPVEPGTFPLAHGAPSRVGRLRAYGNAINAQAAQEFIGAYLDSVSTKE